MFINFTILASLILVPGAGYGGYVRFKAIMDQGILRAGVVLYQIQQGILFANQRPVQGFKILSNNFVTVKGIHYTSWEKATQIRSTRRIEPSLNDPYVYLSEPGKMAGWPESAIKKELGSLSANTEVKLTLVVPIGLLWIKAARQVIHFAIEGILDEEIKALRIHRRKAS